MRLLLAVLAAVALVMCCMASPVLADWYPDDPEDLDMVKMHFPQLPDSSGWDIEILTDQHQCADDWLCTETGDITDIHFWISWNEDAVSFDHIEEIYVEIYDNDDTGPFSKPGNMLWGWIFFPTDWTMIQYGTGSQGFADPQQPWWVRPDHDLYQQINIEDIDLITDPFTQQEGEIYWLAIFVTWSESHAPVGWKTADVSQYPEPCTGRHYMDVAVWRDLYGFWQELIDPSTGDSLDFAFVVTSDDVVATEPATWSHIKALYR